ncbi:MAG: type II and III secretion system protein [Lentisphaeria bacterium]
MLNNSTTFYWSLATAILLTAFSGCKTAPPNSTPNSEKGTPAKAQTDLKKFTDFRDFTNERAELAAAAPEILGSGEKVIALYPCRYRSPDDLRQAIMGLISMEGSIELGTNLNSLIISESKPQAELLLKLLKKLDKPRQQLLVEARVIEVTLDKDFETELKYLFKATGDAFLQNSEINVETPSSSALSSQGILLNLLPVSTSNGETLETFVRLLLERGNGRILSSPNVLVTEGTQAFIHTGEELPIFSTTTSGGTVQVSNEFKSVGVKLRVRPVRVNGDMVEMEILPEVSAVTGFKTGPQGSSAPVVAQRQIQATLRMHDGEIITIGGLLQEEKRRTVRKIPLVADIPLLGKLFQSYRNEDSKTQLIFLLRVHILPEGTAYQSRIHRPGDSLGQFNEDIFEDKSIDMPLDKNPNSDE